VAFAFVAICFSWTFPAMSHSFPCAFARIDRVPRCRALNLEHTAKKGRADDGAAPNQAVSLVGAA
jgi:hypothetical protein